MQFKLVLIGEKTKHVFLNNAVNWLIELTYYLQTHIHKPYVMIKAVVMTKAIELRSIMPEAQAWMEGSDISNNIMHQEYVFWN